MKGKRASIECAIELRFSILRYNGQILLLEKFKHTWHHDIQVRGKGLPLRISVRLHDDQ